MVKTVYRDDHNLIESFSLLETSLDYFESELSKVSARQVALYDIPSVAKEEESLLIGDDYSAIPVQSIAPEAWKAFVTSAVQKLFEHDGKSTRIIKRFPGIVVFDDAPSGLLDAIEHVNQAKKAFKEVVTNNDLSASTRFNWVHDRLPNLVTLYVYRQIPVFHDAFKAAYLNWGSRPTTQIKTKQEIIEFLQQQQAKQQTLTTSAPFTEEIDHYIQLIQQSDFAVYKYKYQQKVSPHCRLMHANPNKHPASLSLKCSLPIFITRQAGLPLLISDLKTYEPKSKRKTRTDDQILIPLKSGGFYGSYKVSSR